MLTVDGEKQAELISAKYADEKIDAIYASPLQRCQDTIAPLAASHDLNVTTDERIIEHMSPDAQDKEFKCSSISWTDKPIAGGESVIDVYNRAEEFLHEIIEKHAGETVVICSH